MPKLFAAAIVAVLVPTVCHSSDNSVYTLYRNSPAFANMRIHVATFDAEEKEPYNLDNCQITAKLFQGQPGISVRYWCERGRYRR